MYLNLKVLIYQKKNINKRKNYSNKLNVKINNKIS